jgi:hypothetical protein
MTQKKLNSRQANWLEEIWCYHHNIVYQRGESNLADPFSRRPDHAVDDLLLSPMVIAQNGVDDITMDIIRAAYLQDPYYADPTQDKIKKLKYENGIYYKGTRLCIPDDIYLRTLLLREAHEPAYSGHQGIQRTSANLSRISWWPHQKDDIMSFITACHSCQINKPSNQAPAGLLQSLPVPETFWESVSLDFMVRLPRTIQGHDAIAVFVDRLSKYVRIIPVKTNMSAIQIANVFQDTVFKHHGIPKTLVSDRDSKFTSEFWKVLFKTLGTKLNMSSSYHPQTDGQTEIMNRHIIAYLRHYIAPLGHDWATHLANAEFALNNHTSSTTG